MTYPIEVLPLGSTSAELLDDVCKRLNEVQTEFDFELPPPRLRDDGIVFTREKYSSDDVFDWLRAFRTKAKGHHPFLVGFVQGPLRTAKYENAFGSHQAKDGLAVVTLDKHTKFARSRAYVAYFLARYAISFVAPDVKVHDDTRGCFFDQKENKYEIRESLLEGKFCDPCMNKLQAVLTPEVTRAVQSMARLIRNLESPPDEVQATVIRVGPVPPLSAADVVAPPLPQSVDESRKQFPWAYAALSLIALVVAVVIIVLLGRSSTMLGNALLFFAAVLTLSLAASLVLFGVLRGFARYQKKAKNETLELGGSAAMFILVLILGYRLTPQPTIEGSTFSITVHARDEQQRPVTKGRLLMTVGQETKPAVLNNDGEGTFKEIANTYRDQKVRIEAQVPQYVLREPSKLYEILPGVINVELQYKPDDPLDALVFSEAGTFEADSLVQTLAGNSGGVVVAPELLMHLKSKRVSLQMPFQNVPLKQALDLIFAQVGIDVVYERTGTITHIRSKRGDSK